MRRAQVLGILGVMVLAVAACSSSSSGDTPAGGAGSSSSSALTGTPIVVGTLAELSGPEAAPWVANTVEAYFNYYNHHGGINGHPVIVEAVDGGTTAASAIAGARQLVDQDHAVALVNAVFADCPVNGAFYDTAKIAVATIPYASQCYQYPSIFPYEADTGPLEGVVGKWAEGLGAKRVAYLGIDLPGGATGGNFLGPSLAKTPDTRLVLNETIAPTATAAEADNFLAKAAADHVDTIDMLTTPQLSELLMQQAPSYHLGPTDGVRWTNTTSFNNEPLLTSLGKSVIGSYVQCNTYCWQANVPEVQKVHSILQAAGVSPIDGLAAQAWDGADLVRQAIQAVKGPITSASVLAAMSNLSHAPLPLAPTPITYRGETPSASNPRPIEGGGEFVEWTGTSFKPVSGWITYPATP